MPEKDISTLNFAADHGYAAGTVDGVLKNFPTKPWSLHQLAGIVSETDTTVTLTPDHEGKLIRHLNSASSTIEIPNDTAMPDWPIGGRCHIFRDGTGSLTVTAVGASGVTLRAAARPKLRNQGSCAELIKIAANEWLLTGDTAA